MKTPIWDFIRGYADADPLRLHMPGHKGTGPLGCERYDITEVAGADALYEARGIIAQSEENASRLFGSGRTLYSTEGSSQCIRAMVYLAAAAFRKRSVCTGKPVMVAARNAHRAFLHACALNDVDVVWLWPQAEAPLISCPVAPAQLEHTLSSLQASCCGVYVTSPDYLGWCQDIGALAQVCHRYGVPLLVDNAHGAYLHFLSEPLHPLDLGADLCCDSAHKTLPALTGGAYLHISAYASAAFAPHAKDAMALFGSTSPSYLTLASLDLCNAYLADEIHDDLKAALPALSDARDELTAAGLLRDSFSGRGCYSPLHLSISGDGAAFAGMLRGAGMEPEYAGPDALVLLFSPKDAEKAAGKAAAVLRDAAAAAPELTQLRGNTEKAADGSAVTAVFSKMPRPEQAMRVREAVFSDYEEISAADAAGRVAAMPTAFCPPAVPPVMPGERITPEAVRVLAYYGYDTVCVVC